MQSVGETLRQARIDKGVSLAEAERDTRIRRRYLEAIEAEDLASLPAPVYTRGFVRTYAEYLGLNPQAISDLYAPAQRQEPAPLRPAVPHVHIPREIPVRPVLIAVAVVAALALIVYGWIQLQQAAAAMREEQGVPSVRTPNATQRQPTPNPIAFNSPVPSPSPSPTSTPEPTPTAVPSPTATAVIDGIVVEFRTTARVFVEAAVDGRGVLAETLPAGSQRTLPAGRDVVVLRASNGSALEIVVNGQRQQTPADAAPVQLTWQR